MWCVVNQQVNVVLFPFLFRDLIFAQVLFGHLVLPISFHDRIRKTAEAEHPANPIRKVVAMLQMM